MTDRISREMTVNLMYYSITSSFWNPLAKFVETDVIIFTLQCLFVTYTYLICQHSQ